MSSAGPGERADAHAQNPQTTGTKIAFLPDGEIFPQPEFRFETLQHRLRELAYLNPGVKIRLIDERVDKDGLSSFETGHASG